MEHETKGFISEHGEKLSVKALHSPDPPGRVESCSASALLLEISKKQCEEISKNSAHHYGVICFFSFSLESWGRVKFPNGTFASDSLFKPCLAQKCPVPQC